MKLVFVLALCAFVAAAPGAEKHEVLIAESPDTPESRNILLNVLIAQFINMLRNLINNGSGLLGIPRLDPLILDKFHIEVPAGLINLDLHLDNAEMIGLGAFLVPRSHLDLSDLSFDVDFNIPRLDISTDFYDFTGDLFTAIPLYGRGKANFLVENFRIRAKIYLRQSDNENAIIIDRIEGATFEIPTFKSNISGAIGGGDIDAIVNAIAEEVILDYINRFHGAISTLVSRMLVSVANPILEQLDTWKYIAQFLP